MASTTRGGIDKYAVNHSKLSLTEECDSDLVRAKWAKNFDGVRFIELVRAIESASLNGSHTAQTDLVRVLVEHADMYEYSHELQRYALLKLLLPGMNGNTYGVKATGLICAWGGVMGQSGAQLARAYVKDPILCSNERNDVVVSCDIFATQLQAQFDFATIGSEAAASQLTIVEVAACCQDLTDSYRHKSKADASKKEVQIGRAASHFDVLRQMFLDLRQRLTASGLATLIKILLRVVPIGVEPRAVLNAFHEVGYSAWVVSCDMGHFEKWTRIVAQKDGASGATEEKKKLLAQIGKVVIGLPFHPMRCNTLTSSHLLPWLFSRGMRAEGMPMTPRRGRLIILPGGVWTVVQSHGGSLAVPWDVKKPKTFTYANINSPDDIRLGRYGTHVRALKIMRDLRMLNVDALLGYILVYYIDELPVASYGRAAYNITLARAVPLPRSPAIRFMSEDMIGSLPEPGTATLNLGDILAKDYADSELLTVTIPLQPQQPQPQQPQYVPNARTRGDAAAATATAAKTAAATITDATIKSTLALATERVDDSVIVERKWDGDRLLAHIGITDGKKLPEVWLFTRHGTPVHNMYKDITASLQNAFSGVPCGGYVLDGELIVVDTSDNKPMPWCNGKWRFDGGGGMSVEEAKKKSVVLASIVMDRTEAEAEDPDEDVELLTQEWLNELKDPEICVRGIAGARLQYVIFDILVSEGKSCHDKMHWERMVSLNNVWASHLLKSPGTHLRLSYNSTTDKDSPSPVVRTYEELQKHLEYSIIHKTEGIVIKNRQAKYKFGKSDNAVKLKMVGPDINCVVIGAGNTMSKNPRNFNLLVGIANKERTAVFAYCRVYHFEGDSPSRSVRQLRIADGCFSRAELEKVQDQLRNKSLALTAGSYVCHVSKYGDGKGLMLQWEPTKSGLTSHTVVLPDGLPTDIFYFAPPMACGFAASIFGELRELTPEQRESSFSTPEPRFPRCRLEFDWPEDYMSYLHTPDDISANFALGYDMSTPDSGVVSGVQPWVAEARRRFIKRCRRFPPRYDRLADLHRALISMEPQKGGWPGAALTPADLSDKAAMNARLHDIGEPPLTAAESRELETPKPMSQWPTAEVMRQVRGVPLIPLEQDLFAATNAKYQLEIEKKRAEELQQMFVGSNLLTGF